MKVGILSNLDAKCGNAEHARNLEIYLHRRFSVVVAPSIMPLADCDVILLNWHPAVVSISVAMVRELQAVGKKVILLHQNSYSDGSRVACSPDDILGVCDAVVVHEKMEGDANFRYIPIGVPLATVSPSIHKRIGTAGFPFSWKRFDVAAEAAKRTGCEFLALAPRYDTYNSSGEIGKILMKQIPRTIIHEDYLPTGQVVAMLSSCTLNIFWYQSESIHDQYGQTGSARFGVGALRPMIISRHRKFRSMIEDYAKELYIADTEEDVYRMAQEILDAGWNAERPLQMYTDTNWEAVSAMYENLILETVQ